MKENEVALEKLRDSIRKKDSELEQLRTERRDMERREEDRSRDVEKCEQTLLDDLNGEYQRLAETLSKSFNAASLTRAGYFRSSSFN